MLAQPDLITQVQNSAGTPNISLSSGKCNSIRVVQKDDVRIKSACDLMIQLWNSDCYQFTNLLIHNPLISLEKGSNQ